MFLNAANCLYSFQQMTPLPVELRAVGNNYFLINTFSEAQILGVMNPVRFKRPLVGDVVVHTRIIELLDLLEKVLVHFPS